MKKLQLVATDLEADIMLITEIRPKYNKEPVVSENFGLHGYTTLIRLAWA